MSEVKVSLTLTKDIADRLRAMCHARGETASTIVARWILNHDERGEMQSPEQRRQASFMEQVQKIIREKKGEP